MKKIALFILATLFITTSAFASATVETNQQGEIIYYGSDSHEEWWTCERCGGTGTVEVEDYDDYSGYTKEVIECPECDGNGGYWVH